MEKLNVILLVLTPTEREAKNTTTISSEDYEEIMDTTNGHNPNLVNKINIAWNTKREQFYPILRTLYKRDIKEIMASDAFGDLSVFGIAKSADEAFSYMDENWDIEAYNYLQHIADDTDLECILNFVRY